MAYIKHSFIPSGSMNFCNIPSGGLLGELRKSIKISLLK